MVQNAKDGKFVLCEGILSEITVLFYIILGAVVAETAAAGFRTRVITV